MLNRRFFLGVGATALLTPHLALAAATTDRRLVFIILRGAMDGLSAVMPVSDPAYAALRGNFGPPPDAGRPLPLGDFALHPALAQTGALYAKGEALFVHAIASPYRERSHFDAQNVLETGGTAAYALKDGWLNRLLPLLPHAGEAAVAISPTLPMALRGAAPATSFAPSQLPQADDDLLARVGALYAGDPQLHALWSAAINARTMAGANATGKSNPAALGKLAATFLAKPADARIAIIEINGWDTHSAQAGRLNNQLKQLDAVIAALRDGLGADWATTAIVAATEFGRTAAPNGTDHGTGGVALVAGGAIKGGRVIADWPGVAPGQLYEARDLRATADLRSLFAGLAAAHFGLDPALVTHRVFGGDPAVRPLQGLVRA